MRMSEIGSPGRSERMNLIYPFLVVALELPFFICLTINELKLDQFLNSESFEKLSDRDFLDIDVSSDVLPTISKVLDATGEKVCFILIIFQIIKF